MDTILVTDDESGVETLPERECEEIKDESETIHQEDNPVSIRTQLDKEFETMLREEIRNASQELIKMHRIALSVVMAEYRRILQEVLTEQLQSIRVKIAEIRKPDEF